MSEERIVSLDVDYESWPVSELHDYYQAVGVNAPYAAAKIDAAKSADLLDLLSQIDPPEDDDAELVSPPGWQPLNMLNVNPDYLLGFAYVPARRERPELTWEAFAREVNGGELLAAFTVTLQQALPVAPEDGIGPFEAESATTPSPKTSSLSATPTSGRSKRSATST